PDVIAREGGTPFSFEASGPLARAVPPAAPVAPSSLLPNDAHFARQRALKNDGTTIQGSGTPGADINATAPWHLETGASWVKIGIVDSGMKTNHPDFTGRVSGDPTGSFPGIEHGTFAAGIAAAQGNNTTGVAGVAWNVGIINEDYGAGGA